MRHKVTIYSTVGAPVLTLEGERVLLGQSGTSRYLPDGSTVYVNADARAVTVEPIPDAEDTIDGSYVEPGEDAAAIIDACVKEIESQIKRAWNAASNRS